MHSLLITAGVCFSLTGSLVSVSTCFIVVIAIVGSWHFITRNTVNRLLPFIFSWFVSAVVICAFRPWTMVHLLIVTLVFGISYAMLQDPSLLDAVERSRVLCHH